MAIVADTFQTFQAIGNREDLSDEIYKIDPTDTPFLTMAEKRKAKATTVEWQTQALAAVDGANKQIQGDQFSNTAVTPTVRLNNKLQISRKVVQVARTQQKIDAAGRKNEMAYQVALKGQELKRDMENILTSNQASTIGATGTPAALGGLESWLTSNVSRGSGGSNGGFSAGNTTAATDGTQRAFTEDLLKAVILSAYNNGGKPDTLMLGTFNRQVFSTFTGNATKFKDISDKRLQASISVYESDFGKLKVVPNLFQRTRTAFVLQSNMYGVASLRSFETEDVAKIADADRKSIISEYTLMIDNQAAHGVIADLTTS